MKLGRKDLDLAKEAAHNSETRTPKSKPSAEISELAHSNPELAFRDWVAMAKISIEQPSSASSIAGLKEPSANFGERVRSLNSLPNMEK